MALGPRLTAYPTSGILIGEHKGYTMTKPENVNHLATMIRKTIADDRRTLYKLALDSSVPYQTLHRFASGGADAVNLKTADGLCRALGLELRRARRKGVK